MTALTTSPTLSTASKLASMAEQILRPSALNETTDLLPVAECRALLTACSSQPNATGDEAINLARSLMALYRKADFVDADMFSTAMCAVFAAYPASIGRQAIDPLKGLPSRLKFPPSIAEAKEALDEAMNRRRLIAYRAKWMLDERDRRDAEARRQREIAAVSLERRIELAEKLRAAIAP